jgi:hypothetical protein
MKTAIMKNKGIAVGQGLSSCPTAIFRNVQIHKFLDLLDPDLLGVVIHCQSVYMESCIHQRFPVYRGDVRIRVVLEVYRVIFKSVKTLPRVPSLL